MDTAIISREIIARQAARAAQHSTKTGDEAQNPYCEVLQPEEHAEFARRYCVAMQRLQEPGECEGSA